MSMIIYALAIRKRLGREIWATPYRIADDTWVFDNLDGRTRIIVSDDPIAEPGVMWVHASISDRLTMPTYRQLKMMHDAVFDGGWAYQVFTPPSDHVNIHNYCLHLFGRLEARTTRLHARIGQHLMPIRREEVPIFDIVRRD